MDSNNSYLTSYRRSAIFLLSNSYKHTLIQPPSNRLSKQTTRTSNVIIAINV